MKEKISVQNFVKEYLDKKVVNTKINEHAIEDFIKGKIDIIEYLPIEKKIDIINNMVSEVVKEIDGVKKVNSITQYMAFIITMLSSHTTLEFGNIFEDYDALNSCGLIEQIVALFFKDYTECETLFKMAVADALADNNLNIIVGKFLNGILDKIDGFGEVVKNFTKDIDVSKLLGTDIKDEDVAKILGFVDKFIK